jgi:hypothetical protein
VIAPAQRHTTATMQRAREMYGDGDSWSLTQIARYLRVDRATVKRWVIPEFAERRRAQQRAAIARKRSEGQMLDRMRELRAAGMPHSGIAIILRLDWGVDANADRVRYWLRVGREPRTVKRRAARDAT